MYGDGDCNGTRSRKLVFIVEHATRSDVVMCEAKNRIVANAVGALKPFLGVSSVIGLCEGPRAVVLG